MVKDFEMINELIEETKKDPTILTWAVCDASTFFGNNLKEKYEGLYMKVCELTNVILARGADESSLTLATGRYFGEIFKNNRWSQRVNDSMPNDRIEIGSNIGKVIIGIVNVDYIQG